MKRIPSIAVTLAAVALAASPANAQYATEFSPAKLIKQGTTSVPIAGSGTVVVQVQVNSDGTHKSRRRFGGTVDRAILGLPSGPPRNHSGNGFLRFHAQVQWEVGCSCDR
jgi:hypothetical protein